MLRESCSPHFSIILQLMVLLLDYFGELWRNMPRSSSQKAKSGKSQPPPKDHPKAYRSALRPYFGVIQTKRRNGESWKAITEYLATAHGVSVGFQTVQRFFKRALQNQGPLGFPELLPTPGRTMGAAEPRHPSTTKEDVTDEELGIQDQESPSPFKKFKRPTGK
jgi:hypothetical protein